MIENTVFVATRDWLLAFDDDGDRPASWLAATSCSCTASDPIAHGRAYCAAEQGLWRSDDGGTSWRVVHDVAREQRVTAVSVSATERGPDGSSVVYIGTEPSALFRSADGGATWDELRSLVALPSASTWCFPPRPETHHVRSIAPDPIQPSRLFVAIEAGALVHTDDAGRTWHDRVPDGPRDTHTLVIHPHAPKRLYSAAGDGYFESHDGGATWQKPERGLRHRYVWGCVVDPRDPETTIISASSSPMNAHNADRAESWIYRRSAGGPWTPVSEGLPDPKGTTVSVLAIAPIDTTIVYAANNCGIFRSNDMGQTWGRLDVPWPDRLLKQRIAGLAVGQAE